MNTSTAKKQDQRELEAMAREARNAYTREWRKKNPNKVKQYNKDYWVRKAQEMQQ